METIKYYNQYTKISDIFEQYVQYNFDQKLIDFLIGECANFLYSKGIDRNVIKYFSLEFEVSVDNSFVQIRGGNLMASLWLINVFPPYPEKYIEGKLCFFENKNYIYEPKNKSLKIKKHGYERSGSKKRN
jgi:hypothetical protein